MKKNRRYTAPAHKYTAQHKRELENAGRKAVLLKYEMLPGMCNEPEEVRREKLERLKQQQTVFGAEVQKTLDTLAGSMTQIAGVHIKSGRLVPLYAEGTDREIITITEY